MSIVKEKQAETPMMRQYNQIKEKFKDCILFFRLGDFYEMFDEDAKEAARILNITLTARHKGDDAVPMCGVPYHSAGRYIARLTALGRKVAICEQISDPNSKGIVEREVMKVVTPGMTFDERILLEKENNFVISIFPKEHYFGFAFIDVTTGDFQVTEISGFEKLADEIVKLSAKECVLNPNVFAQNTGLKNFLARFPDLHVFTHELIDEPYKVLTAHFKTQSLDGFGLAKLPFGIQAAGLLLDYVKSNQKAVLSHISSVRSYATERFMHLNEATVRNLELFRTMYERKREGSLLSVLDMSGTAMGGRLLISWLSSPLIELDPLLKRHEAVAEFCDNQDMRLTLTEKMKEIQDIERILGKIGCGGGNARDLLALRNSLLSLPDLKKSLAVVKSSYLKELNGQINLFEDLAEILLRAIEDQPPTDVKSGGMIREGYHLELDRLKNLSAQGKSFIADLQQREQQRSGINSLKVRYNKVFGYFIEVTKVNLDRVPQDYIRKQTMTNAERFITPELKEYEEKILTAEEKIIEIEYTLFCELKDKVAAESRGLQKTCQALAQIDVLLSFAMVALKHNYVRPEMSKENIFEVTEGRHPVLELQGSAGEFVPNDTLLNEKNYLVLITGPNMAGKSTYLRQNALIGLMAQIGSFVPAARAKLGILDNIFTRVGASDNLIRGQSTFMVEMYEAAYILHHATERSLIVLDEIGRGTSTYDGVSIAWALMEYLHDRVRAKTLFASHYHELIAVAEKLERAQNCRVEVRENPKEGVVFLHKVVSGGSDKSYGIEVAKLAGLPSEIVSKAQHLLHELEEGILDKGIKVKLSDHKHRIPDDQMDLFARMPEYHPALERLKSLDVNRITPLQALTTLSELKNECGVSVIARSAATKQSGR